MVYNLALRAAIAERYKNAFLLRGEEGADFIIVHVYEKDGKYYAMGLRGGQVVHHRLNTWDDYECPEFAETYDDALMTSEEKLAANLEFCELLNKYLRSGRNIIVLDSYSGETTKALYYTRVRYDKIYIPNPHEDFLKNCDRAVKDLVHYENESGDHDGIVCSTVYEFFRDLPDDDMRRFDLALDYCCTARGCKTKCVPALDLELIFGLKKFPRHNGILWLTFSLRGDNFENTKAMTQKMVSEISNKYGYVMICEKSVKYGRMARFLFRSRADLLKKTQTTFHKLWELPKDCASPKRKRHGVESVILSRHKRRRRICRYSKNK